MESRVLASHHSLSQSWFVHLYDCCLASCLLLCTGPSLFYSLPCLFPLSTCMASLYMAWYVTIGSGQHQYTVIDSVCYGYIPPSWLQVMDSVVKLCFSISADKFVWPLPGKWLFMTLWTTKPLWGGRLVFGGLQVVKYCIGPDIHHLCIPRDMQSYGFQMKEKQPVKVKGITYIAKKSVPLINTF